MREVKFRARHKETHEIDFYIDFNGILQDGFTAYPNEYQLEQYTGEKDIEGNEIYQNDILLKHHEYPYEEPFVVKDICDIYDVDSPDEKSKIIGDIYGK